jgi:hypothetical protein
VDLLAAFARPGPLRRIRDGLRQRAVREDLLEAALVICVIALTAIGHAWVRSRADHRCPGSAAARRTGGGCGW